MISNRRQFLKSCANAFTAVGFLPLGSCLNSTRISIINSESSTKPIQNFKKPNVIFIMADDMGYGDAGCYNDNSKIPTPNIDHLAKQGLKFTDAHAPSAVCSPTRYGVLTGRYAWRTRMKNWVLTNFCRPLIEPDRLTLANLFKDCGYQTACIGKWHLGLGWQTKDGREIPLNKWAVKGIVDKGWNIDYSKKIEDGPLDLGFDYFFGGPGNYSAPPYCFIENRQTKGIPDIEKNKLDYSPRFPGPMNPGPMAKDWKDDQIGSIITNKAVQTIERFAKRKKPFFLYFPLHAPHRPCVPPSFVQGASQAGNRGDMVAEVDWTVGQLLNTLKKLDIEKDTLLIFTSDNGATHAGYKEGVTFEKKYGHNPNRPWRGYKAQIWEGGHRVPFIIKWPGIIEPGTISRSPIMLTDMMASFAALLNYELPDNAAPDSHNVLANLIGKKNDDGSERTMVFHSCFGRFSIRSGKWKLVLPNPPLKEPDERRPGWAMPGDKEPQLFDIDEDPQETKDLALQHPEITQKLEETLIKIKKLDLEESQ